MEIIKKIKIKIIKIIMIMSIELLVRMILETGLFILSLYSILLSKIYSRSFKSCSVGTKASFGMLYIYIYIYSKSTSLL